MENHIAIKISHLYKTFKLPHERQGTLKSSIINFRKRGYEKHKVLSDLNIEIEKGDFIGIIGRNGSGKSTLLKLLAGIYTPDSGSIEINGKLTPFIELGVGFNPELSGRDNVYLNGALLGFSRIEVDEIYDDIVEFAELENFMDQKLKNFSSGMQVRLAFSIAIRANTDILVLDEVLAVGDEAFQRKCYEYFSELKQRGKTVVLVTHDMSAVQRFCTRALVIDDGNVIYDGSTEEATDIYRNLNLKRTEQSSAVNNKKREKSIKKSKSDCFISELYTMDTNGVKKMLYGPNEKITISCVIKTKKFLNDLDIILTFNNPGGTALSSLKTTLRKNHIKQFSPGQSAVVEWTIDGVYNDGKYLISAIISDVDSNDRYSHLIDGCEFSIVGWDDPSVLVHPKNKHSVKIGY